MLWVMWHGFSGGSQLAADGVTAMARTVDDICTAVAFLAGVVGKNQI